MLKAFTALIFCVFIIFLIIIIIIIIPPLLCRSISSTYFNLHTSSIYQHFQLFKGFLGPVQHFQKNSYISYFFNVLWKILKYSNPIQIRRHVQTLLLIDTSSEKLNSNRSIFSRLPSFIIQYQIFNKCIVFTGASLVWCGEKSNLYSEWMGRHL